MDLARAEVRIGFMELPNTSRRFCTLRLEDLEQSGKGPYKK